MPEFQTHLLDLKFQGSSEAIGAFLLVGPDGPVLIETGAGSTLPTLHKELARIGVQSSAVRDVLVTHIHLDHAGAAGWWAQQGARVYVHQVGAPHLQDPSKLLASAKRIYGDRMDTLWGDLLPAPADQLIPLKDGDLIKAGGLEIRALDTPGHACHHMVYQVENVAFTGDLAGIRLSGRNHIRLPTPPPEFHLEEWLNSIAKMRALRFSHLYLTHFGTVDDVENHWSKVKMLLRKYTALVGHELALGSDREALVGKFSQLEEERFLNDGCEGRARALYAGVGPVGMSVDGMIRYWRKRTAR